MDRTGENLIHVSTTDDAPNARYWDHFYAYQLASDEPSQFAHFCIPYLQGIETIHDVGCGSGRDTKLFAMEGYRVFGIDSCPKAVELATAATQQFRDNCRINQADLMNYQFKSLVYPQAIYMRWILHAVTPSVYHAIFQRLAELREGTKLFIEARAVTDVEEYEDFSGHYRRYLSPWKLARDVTTAGYDLTFMSNRRGFSVQGKDDPLLTRIVATKC